MQWHYTASYSQNIGILITLHGPNNTLVHLNGYDWLFSSLNTLYCTIQVANTGHCESIRKIASCPKLPPVQNLIKDFSTNTTVDIACKVKQINMTHSRQLPNRCLLRTYTERDVGKLFHYPVNLGSWCTTA